MMDATRTRTSARRGEAGFTVIEVILAATIVLMVVGVAIYGLLLGQKSVDEGIRRGSAEQNVSRALSVMLPEIRQSGMAASGSGIAIEPNFEGLADKKLTFRKNQGFNGSAIIWSSPVSFEWRAVSPDGLHRDVILRTDGSGSVSRVGAGIDSTFRFTFGPSGDQLRIAIASTVPLAGEAGAHVTYAVTETALLRN